MRSPLSAARSRSRPARTGNRPASPARVREWATATWRMMIGRAKNTMASTMAMPRARAASAVAGERQPRGQHDPGERGQHRDIDDGGKFRARHRAVARSRSLLAPHSARRGATRCSDLLLSNGRDLRVHRLPPTRRPTRRAIQVTWEAACRFKGGERGQASQPPSHPHPASRHAESTAEAIRDLRQRVVPDSRSRHSLACGSASGMTGAFSGVRQSPRAWCRATAPGTSAARSRRRAATRCPCRLRAAAPRSA